MILYFSGTGNSRYAAELLSEQLNEELLDLGKRIKSGEKSPIFSTGPWVFVSPTYGWQLPHIFEEYLRAVELLGDKRAYFVLTCGSDIGGAGRYLAELCQAKGLIYRGTLEVVMPENYIALFPVPEEQEAEQIIERALPVLQHGVNWIAQDRDFPQRKVGIVDRIKSGLVNRAFYRFVIKADLFYAKDSCVGCGKCVANCPLNNVKLNNQIPVGGKHCTHCMACICNCPAQAIEYGSRSKNKPRYRCLPYKKQ